MGLALLLVIAAAIRLAGVEWNQAFVYHADEPNNLVTVLSMLQSGDLNPHWFHYGSLMFYLNGAVLGVVTLLGGGGLGSLQLPEIVALGRPTCPILGC